MTAEEFEAAYAKRSGMAVATLRKWKTVRACTCGDDSCEGWAMVSLTQVEDWDAHQFAGQVPGSVIEGRP